MELINDYAFFIKLFFSCIVVGTAVKFALVKNPADIQIGNKLIPKSKLTGFGMIVVLGIIIQIVSDSLYAFSKQTLLTDPMIMSAFAIAAAILIIKKT